MTLKITLAALLAAALLVTTADGSDKNDKKKKPAEPSALDQYIQPALCGRPHRDSPIWARTCAPSKLTIS